ncbi:MAG: hypothetical protein IJ453_04210 [Oscillospiraceae bacterium]|nr:hypothetical protein [Oscillospiraceae bacterium]
MKLMKKILILLLALSLLFSLCACGDKNDKVSVDKPTEDDTPEIDPVKAFVQNYHSTVAKGDFEEIQRLAGVDYRASWDSMMEAMDMDEFIAQWRTGLESENAAQFIEDPEALIAKLDEIEDLDELYELYMEYMSSMYSVNNDTQRSYVITNFEYTEVSEETLADMKSYAEQLSAGNLSFLITAQNIVTAYAVSYDITSNVNGEEIMAGINTYVVKTTDDYYMFAHYAAKDELMSGQAPDSGNTEYVATVSDYYSDFVIGDVFDPDAVHCYHIPWVLYELGNEELNAAADAFNGTVYEEVHAFLEQYFGSYEYPAIDFINYSWGQKGDILSIYVKARLLDADYTVYFVYNMAVSTGAPASNEEVLAAYGLSEEDYLSQVGSVIYDSYAALRGGVESGNVPQEQYDELLSKSMDDVNMVNAIPLVGPDGQLWVNIGTYSYAGAGWYDHIFDLSTGTYAEFPLCTEEHVLDLPE